MTDEIEADRPNTAAPVYDDTSIDDAALRDANSTTAETDRGAFNPRGRLASAGNMAKGGIAVAAAFFGFIVYSMAAQSGQKPLGPDDSIFQLDDAAAEKSARQVAKVVVQDTTPQYPPALAGVGVDPLGNPPIGQDLSSAGQVPGLQQQQNGQQQPYAQQQGRSPVQERLERERQARLAEEQRERARRDAMRRAPVMAIGQASAPSGGGNAGPFSNLRVGGDGGDSGAQGTGDGSQNNVLQQRLTGMTIPTVNASRLGNRNFLVVAGSQLPCVLQTAMDSTQPGLTSCIVPHDIWSANGNVILMEKGTRVLGEYQGGISTGEQRIFVLWNRAITPAGISVSLGSPAADQLGRAGMGGQVDNFFWQRFGGALLLSIVGDAGNAVSNSVSGVEQTTQVPNAAAAVAAQDSQRIRPRLRAAQGQEMTIMVARDVDFSSVYSLRLRR